MHDDERNKLIAKWSPLKRRDYFAFIKMISCEHVKQFIVVEIGVWKGKRGKKTEPGTGL